MAGAVGAWGLLTLLAPAEGGHGPASLLPAFVAIAIALATHRVITALLSAVVVGALLAGDFAPGPSLSILGETVLGPAITDPDNLLVVGFAVLLVAMVKVLTSTGALARLLRPFARVSRSRRSAQLSAAGMGCAIFFDDYANSLVVGAAARPLTDARRISREKLAWIVDATAAPIAGLVIVSSWVAYEVKLLDGASAHFSGFASGGFELLVASLPYRFYCIFSLAFVWMLILSGRDFGPMLKAERRALGSGRVHPDPAGPTAPPHPPPATGPVALWIALGAIAAVIAGGLISALDAEGDALQVLFFAACASFTIAVGGSLAARLLRPRELVEQLRGALAQVLPLLAILMLAFALRNAASVLGTGDYLAPLAADVPVGLLPLVSFALAALIAFSTGTSWGTMGILIPLALPLAAELTAQHPDGGLIILLVAASVLDGAIFGDHCSLISDTTIITSAACDCPVVAHFRTQVPYTLPPMLAATLPGYALVGLIPSLPWAVSLGLGLALSGIIIVALGRRPTVSTA